MKCDRFLNAIRARQDGCFDDPDLLSFGELTNEADDVTYIRLLFLRECGFFVGARDSRLNTNYEGRFMVLETPDEVVGPTVDGANGPRCIVGDDLDKLITTAFDYAVDVYGEQP